MRCLLEYADQGFFGVARKERSWAGRVCELFYGRPPTTKALPRGGYEPPPINVLEGVHSPTAAPTLGLTAVCRFARLMGKSESPGFSRLPELSQRSGREPGAVGRNFRPALFTVPSCTSPDQIPGAPIPEPLGFVWTVCLFWVGRFFTSVA